MDRIKEYHLYGCLRKHIFRPKNSSSDRVKQLYKTNNPKNEPVGHFTGRCANCGSNDLWDDNLAYGCNKCGNFLNGN